MGADVISTESHQEGYAVITNGLTRRFGRKLALDGVSARVPVGSIYGLMGPNGAGKTTFIRCLLNLMNPTSGSGMVLGHDIVRDSVAVRRQVAHVAALQPLWDWMTVRELASFMAGCYPKWNQGAVEAVLSPVGIDLNDKIQDLSRGQRTLAALAVAIGHEPELLLLDEALTGLDPTAAAGRGVEEASPPEAGESRGVPLGSGDGGGGGGEAGRRRERWGSPGGPGSHS